MTNGSNEPERSTLQIATVTAPPPQWALDIQDEEGGRRVPIVPSRLIVGSASTCDVVLHDPTVSARHCELTAHDDWMLIEDLGSTNGTFVGGARVREARGGLGTLLTLGRSTIVITSAGNRPERKAPDDPEATAPLPRIAGGSMPMRQLAAQVRRLARHSAPVLIAGETGTGKELIARSLHEEGPRRGRPFVAVNVAALPRELIESELFGHERGAFTGAVARRLGAFTEAEGGTLFLDEIGELPLEAQPKILRALDGYEVRRVGAAGGQRSSARVVAATHVPLEACVAKGTFRRDLFHRLEVFVVEVPPLRARRGDIPAIARALLAQMASELGPRQLSPRAIARLCTHTWPGNVRELRNVLYRACDLADGHVISADMVDHALKVHPPSQPPPTALTPSLAKALFREHKGNLSAAARAASCPRTSFRKLLHG